jgi:signal transduction histidine kinase
MSLTSRFLLGFALVASVGLFVLFSQLIRRVERQYFEAIEEPMVDVANILAEILVADAKNGVLEPQAVEQAIRAAHGRELNAQIYNRTKTQVDMQVYVTDAQGRVLFDSAGIEKPGTISNHRDVNLTLMGQYGARSSRISSASPHMPGHQMKTLAKALEDMRDALEGREYVENYVQSLTHELKSPVAAILGASEILQGDVPEPKRARFLQNIRSEADRLRDLLERLLHLAALEKQKTLENRESVNLREMLDRAWDHHALIAASREVSLQRDLADELVIQGDPWLIELALSNLIQNAIDFAPKGSAIVIRYYRFDAKAVIEIEDRGPGIPDYARERVFERFYSLPRPDTGKKSTGLGLCFVKEVAQLHGGSVELSNVEGGTGAKAMLILPA